MWGIASKLFHIRYTAASDRIEMYDLLHSVGLGPAQSDVSKVEKYDMIRLWYKSSQRFISELHLLLEVENRPILE